MTFVDLVYQENKHHNMAYRTGTTVYQESLISGQYVGRGWNGSGFVHEEHQLLNPASHANPQAFHLEIDGQALISHWDWQGMTQDERDGILHVVVELVHRVRPVSVRIHTELDGTPVISRWLEITNTGEQPAALSACSPWCGVLYTGSNLGRAFVNGEDVQHYSVGYMIGDEWAHEGNFEWRPLPNARLAIDGRYRRGRARHPMFVLRNELTGEHFIGQFAWSGGYSFEFDCLAPTDKSMENVRLHFRASIDTPAPIRMIQPGETVKTPEMLLGMVPSGFDVAVQGMHDHLRRSFFYPQPRGRSGWIESFIGPEYEITPELVNQSIEAAAEIGAEIFFVDASWYSDHGTTWESTVGDWNVGNRFPDGTKPFRDLCHEKGLLWGLWMEAERLGSKSQARAKYPEFLGQSYSQTAVADQPFTGILDLANPRVANWVEDQICRVVDEHKCDFFRLDANFASAIIQCTERDCYVENNAWRYYDALYGMFDRVRERFPDLILENCAGGGGRTDVGQVRRFSHTWVTDWQCAPRSFSITNGMTIALPPEYVDRQLVGTGLNNHLAGEIDFQTRLCLFGRPTVAGMLCPRGEQPNPLVISRIKHMLEIYKSFVRPIMATGRIYHHSPTLTQRDPKGIGVIELASHDKTKAVAGVFHCLGFGEQEHVLRFRGLDPGRRYEVICDNAGGPFELEGHVLVYEGLTVRLENPVTSELVICMAI